MAAKIGKAWSHQLLKRKNTYKRDRKPTPDSPWKWLQIESTGVHVSGGFLFSGLEMKWSKEGPLLFLLELYLFYSMTRNHPKIPQSYHPTAFIFLSNLIFFLSWPILPYSTVLGPVQFRLERKDRRKEILKWETKKTVSKGKGVEIKDGVHVFYVVPHQPSLPITAIIKLFICWYPSKKQRSLSTLSYVFNRGISYFLTGFLRICTF